MIYCFKISLLDPTGIDVDPANVGYTVYWDGAMTFLMVLFSRNFLFYSRHFSKVIFPSVFFANVIFTSVIFLTSYLLYVIRCIFAEAFANFLALSVIFAVLHSSRHFL